MKHPFYQKNFWTGWIDLYWEVNNKYSDKVTFKTISPNYGHGGIGAIMRTDDES